MKALIIGAGGQCRVVISILNDIDQYEVMGILDSSYSNDGELIMGYSVVGKPEDLSEWYAKGVHKLFIAVGDNTDRKKYYELGTQLGFDIPNLVSPLASVDKTSILGKANVICARAFVGPMVKIGSNNIINTASIIEHESSMGDHGHLCPGTVLAGRSSVGEGCFVGANSTIIDKISIGDNLTIGAGSVVLASIRETDATYVGVPARRVK